VRRLGCAVALTLVLGAFALPAPTARGETPAATLSLLVPTSADASDVTWLPVRRGPFRVSEATTGLELVTPGATPHADPIPAPTGKLLPKLGVRVRHPGHFTAVLGALTLSLDAVEVRVLDVSGAQIDPKRSHAALSRTLPSELGGVAEEDRDALSYLLIAPVGAELSALELLSRGVSGQPIDVLPKLRAEPSACPDGVAPELVCRRTMPLRALGDALERGHPAARARSIRAQLGGTLRLSSGGQALVELKVGGPRQTRFGPIQRLRARVRVLVLRSRAGGAPALGTDDAGARKAIQSELDSASSLWAQCGIELGAPGAPPIQVVDPPDGRLLTLGCDWGQAASGGLIRLSQGRLRFQLETRPGESPSGVGRRLADLLQQSPLKASVFENQRSASAPFATVDLLIGQGAGRGAAKTEPLEVSSSDPTLPLCSAKLDLEDGLSHFGDGDAFAGTMEERALLRALDDGDPRSIEVLVVPSFVREERIGESFIASPGSSLSSTVIIDRSAIRAGARSFALAHELGHVLLAMPGHPDDFGVDQSWSLMDADVADPTIFGPRRLSVADCERALIQSGPDSLLPLLEAVPLR
jgi:hypothetical protein